MDEDVDIGDMGTPRVVDEAYELEHFNSPSHIVFSIEPRLLLWFYLIHLTSLKTLWMPLLLAL